MSVNYMSTIKLVQATHITINGNKWTMMVPLQFPRLHLNSWVVKLK